jgi:hypothetical protein
LLGWQPFLLGLMYHSFEPFCGSHHTFHPLFHFRSITIRNQCSFQFDHFWHRNFTIYWCVTTDGTWILVIEFIDHLYTLLGNVSNYSATANHDISQITKATSNPFSSLLYL